MSRLDPIMKNLVGNESPDDLATEILDVLTEGSNVPEAGNYMLLQIILSLIKNIECLIKKICYSAQVIFMIIY